MRPQSFSSPWIYRRFFRSQARARLFCFHHAGGGPSAYRNWSDGVPEALEVCAINLPGREMHIRESLVGSIRSMVQGVVAALEPHLELPFAFFGHSMGAILASEVARALVSLGKPLPHHLIVSGRRPPHVSDPHPPFSHLPNSEFAAEIHRRYGGIPAELLRHEEVLAFLLPSLRADIAALEAHRPPKREPLDIPISAFGGVQDRLTPREHLEAWRDETRAGFRIRTFEGDHFYLKPRENEVLVEVVATLSPMF